MDRKRVAKAIAVGAACVLVCVVFHPVEGLRCRTNEGPSTEDVKRIVQTCLNKITNRGENRSSDEYPNYDSSYSDESNEEEGNENGKETAKRRGASNSKFSTNGRNDGNDRGYGNGRMNRPEDGRRQVDRRDQRNDDGRNGHPRASRDRGQRERHDEDDMMTMRDYGKQPRRRRRQSYGGQGSPMGSSPPGPGGDISTYGRSPPYQTYGENGAGNGSRNGSSSSSSLERDRACLMQCFFEELKATNADGFPEKHKVLHVITKDIRERELREFYADSIQECFHMIGMDSRLKDKCDYSMHFVTCLSDRFQANCNDWDTETSAMF